MRLSKVGLFLILFTLFLVSFFLFFRSTSGQQGAYINPHIRMNGTYVPGRTVDGSDRNIYFRQREVPLPNSSPFTGQPGFENPYSDYNIHPTYNYNIYDHSQYGYPHNY